MKRLSFFVSGMLLLAACGGPAQASYTLSIRAETPEDRQTLALQSMHVIERRLDAMGEILADKEVKNESGAYSINIAAKHRKALEALTEQLTEPFSLTIMVQAPAEEATLTVEGQGGFKETGITQDDLVWAQSRDDGSGRGEVRLVFTDAGQGELRELFKTAAGKKIGIFVRGQLVSLTSATEGDVSSDITIRGIPDMKIAQVFADDVNVGINVTFTPRP